MTGLEPVTSSLPRKCSTTELHWQERAENETRTRDPNLGKVVLYQLSYFRMKSGYPDSNRGPSAPKADALTGLRYTPISEKKFAERGGFEPPEH